MGIKLKHFAIPQGNKYATVPSQSGQAKYTVGPTHKTNYRHPFEILILWYAEGKKTILLPLQI